jgi:alpha-L-rhamnosidase
MTAEIIARQWVQPWFDESMSFHMPSLTRAPNGNLLCVWNGGRMQWNGDPMGRDANNWLSVLRPGAAAWSRPEALGSDLQYACHDPIFLQNKQGEILLLFAKFLDTQVNPSTWCNGRDKLWARTSPDGGETWRPAQPVGIQAGHASNDGVLTPEGHLVFAATSSEVSGKYFGAIRVFRSTDDGKTFAQGPLLSAEGVLVREPALCLRPGGALRMFTRTCPANTGWGEAGGRSLPSYTSESLDGGRTWSPLTPSGIRNNESKLDVLSWDEDTILMAYNDTPETDWHERSPLALAASQDEGRTWRNLAVVAGAPGNKCQPALCRDGEGRLNLVYMHRHTAVEHVVIRISV